MIFEIVTLEPVIDRPYKCDMCTAAYTMPWALKMHKQKDHVNNGKQTTVSSFINRPLTIKRCMCLTMRNGMKFQLGDSNDNINEYDKNTSEESESEEDGDDQ